MHRANRRGSDLPSAPVPSLLATAGDPELRDSAMWLHLSSLDVDPGAADSLSSPLAIHSLSALLAAPDQPLAAQTQAAQVLAHVAAVAGRGADATQALVDVSIPRACEVLHQSAAGRTPTAADAFGAAGRAQALLASGGGGAEAGTSGKGGEGEAALGAACAALIARVAICSRLCCHLIIFHTELLQTLVAALVASRQYALARALLDASADYANNPTAGGVV